MTLTAPPNPRSVFTFGPVRGFLLPAAMLAVISSHSLACESPRLVFDATAMASNPRPVIEWSKSTGADSYRIDLLSRVPEGRILENISVDIAATRFQPPRAIATEKAVVMLEVRANCQGTWSQRSSQVYLLDLAGQCPPPEQVSASRQDQRIVVRWKAPPATSQFDVAQYAPPDMRLIKLVQSAAAEVWLPDAGHSIIAIRNRCAIGLSAPAFLAL